MGLPYYRRQLTVHGGVIPIASKRYWQLPE